MGGIEELLYSRALTVLRDVRGWTQKELSAASGDRSETLSGWENGRPAPNRATLVRLTRAMGFRESMVDKTLEFLETAIPAFPGRQGGGPGRKGRGSGGSGGAGSASPVEDQVDDLARRLAAEHETTLRRNFRAGIREGLAILEREIAEGRPPLPLCTPPPD